MLTASSQSGGAGISNDDQRKLYFLAVFASLGSCLPAGILLDRAGPRACFCVAHTLCGIGLATFTGGAHTAGVLLLAVGTAGCMCSVMHVSALFERRRHVIVALVAGTYQVSLLVFPIIGWIFSSGAADAASCFAGLAVLGAFNATAGFFVWPDVPYDAAVTPEDDTAAVRAGVAASDGAMDSCAEVGPEQPLLEAVDTDAAENSGSTVVQAPRLVDQLWSPLLWEFNAYTIIITSWAQTFFIGTLRDRLNDRHFLRRGTVSDCIDVFNVVSPAAALCNPFLGAFLTKHGFTVGVFAVTAVSLLFCGTLVMRTEGAVLTSIVCNSLCRNFLWTYYYARVAATFGFANFGILTGVTTLLLGLIGLVCDPLAAWAQGTCHEINFSLDRCDRGHWLFLDWVQLASIALVALLHHVLGYRRGKHPARPAFVAPEGK